MKNRLLSTLILAVLLIPVISFSKNNNNQAVVIKRFAVVVGSSQGGKNRVQLRYALQDAESFLKLLNELGGIAPEDGVIITDPDSKTLFTAIENLNEKIKAAKSKYHRVELIFYYSGHSDDKSFLLGKEKVAYKDFRDAFDKLEADVRIAILDSCASGAFTRIKGGKKILPFLVDRAYNMKGYAILTSSSLDEASQESDMLQGSFFTHYLISGMRGAADASQDGRITLSEAYQFAFNETLSQTEKTLSGPQHPNHEFQMSGTGDVVLTDIRLSSVILTIDKNVSGKIFIHNQDDHLVAELTKAKGQDIVLGLDKGEYRAINLTEDGVYEAHIKLTKKESFTLASNQFKKTDKEYAIPKGRSVPALLSRTGNSFFSLGINGGAYLNQDKNVKEIYGQSSVFWGGGLDYLIFLNEKNGVGLSLSLIYVSATSNAAYFDETVDLTIMPVSLSLLYTRKIGILYPFVGIGADYFSFKEAYPETFNLSSTSDKAFGFSFQTGAFIRIGSFLSAKTYLVYHNARANGIAGRINLGGTEFGLRLSYHFNLR